MNPRRAGDLADVGLGHRGDENARLAAIGHDEITDGVEGIHARPRAMSPKVRPACSGRCGDTATRTTSHDWDAAEVGQPIPRDVVAQTRADVATAEALEHGGDAALP
jgi:hypothetical protein